MRDRLNTMESSLMGLQTWDLDGSWKVPHRVQMPRPYKAALTQWSKDMDEVMSSLDAIKETMARNVSSDVTVVMANKQPLVFFSRGFKTRMPFFDIFGWHTHFKAPEVRLYLYGGLGWWFGSLGNQSYVQNRFEKCVFLCVLYLFYFLFN